MNKKIMTIGIISMFMLMGTITVSASDNTSVSTSTGSSPTVIEKKHLYIYVYDSSGALVPNAKVTVDQWHFLRHYHASGYTNRSGVVAFIVIGNYNTITRIHASAGFEYCNLLFYPSVESKIDIYLHPFALDTGIISQDLQDGVVSI